MMFPSLDAVDIKVDIENGVIDIKRLPVKEQGSPPFEKIMYLIHGLEEGESQLSFSSEQCASEVQSDTNSRVSFTSSVAEKLYLTCWYNLSNIYFWWTKKCRNIILHRR